MGRRCIFGCANSRNLYPFPLEPWLRKQWLEFAHFEEGGLCMNSRLCDRHFSEEFFTNLKMYTAGLASYLKLSENAVPSVYTVGASPSVKAATRDVGCQCEIIKSTTVQVKQPETRLKNKATQVRPLTKTASSCTSHLGGGGRGGDDVLLSTSTPVKRRRSEAAEDSVTDSPVETDGARVPVMQSDST